MQYILDYYGAVKYARTVCANSNMQVEFHKLGTLATPFTTGTVIHVEQPDAQWTKKEWDRWFYRLYHELGHEHEVNCDPHWKTVMMETGTNKPSILSSMVNLISDHVQEHNRVGEFKGVDRVLLEGRADFVREYLLSDEAITSISQGRNHDIFVAAAIFDTIQRGKWNPLLRGIGEGATAKCINDRQEMVNTLIDSAINIAAGKNEWDSYEIAKAILEALGEDVEAMEEALNEESEGAPGDSDGEPEDGEGEGEGTPSDGEGTEGGTGISAGELSEKEAEAIGKAFDHDHMEAAKHDAFAGEMFDSRFDTSHARPVDNWVVRDPIVVDIPKGIYPSCGRESLKNRAEDGRDWGVESITHYSRPSILGKRLRNLIISKRASRTEHGLKSGRISRKHLWRANKQMAATDVYCRKTSEITKASAVTILVDASTSMRGPKYGISNRAAIVLQQALQKAQVPVEVLEFSEDYEGPINIIVKPFSEMNVSEQEITDRCGKCHGLLGMNSDGESLLWAYNRLVRQEAPRKVLIVLSDGQPCACGGSTEQAANYLKFVASNIEAGPVELYGVGVETNAVKDFYSDYCVINDADELESTLLEIVKKKVVR